MKSQGFRTKYAGIALLTTAMAVAPVTIQFSRTDGLRIVAATSLAKDGNEGGGGRESGGGERGGGRESGGGERGGERGGGGGHETGGNRGGGERSGGGGHETGGNRGGGERSGGGGHETGGNRGGGERSGGGGHETGGNRGGGERGAGEREMEAARGLGADDVGRKAGVGGGALEPGRGAGLGDDRLRVLGVDKTEDGIEISYSNGMQEQISGGRYELKNAAGRTIVERAATPEDVARINDNLQRSGTEENLGAPRAGRAGAPTASITARVPRDSRAERVEIAGKDIAVSYSTGWIEEITDNRYEMKDPNGNTVVERAASPADRDRLAELASR